MAESLSIHYILLVWCISHLHVQYISGQPSSDVSMKLSISTGGDYNISVNGNQFLRSAKPFFNVEEEKFLPSPNQTYAGNGSDQLGAYQFIKYLYVLSSKKVKIEAWIKDYSPKPFVTFDTVYVSGAVGTRSNTCQPTIVPFMTCFEETVSGFPSFQVGTSASTITLGYLNFGGKMVGNVNKQYGIFNSKTPKMTDGMKGGPLVIFSDKGTSLVISPLDNFMSSSMWHQSAPGGTVSWGVMGGVTEIPANFTLRTLVVAGNGINKAMRRYGEVLTAMYRSASELRKTFQNNDITLNYLGYWTDNGAYYYYNTEKDSSYEDTLQKIHSYAYRSDIPYKYLQLDSWWYYKGFINGVRNWTALPSVFPNGIKYLHDKTNYAIAAHNRYWSTDNVYSKQNGGKYNFVKGVLTSLPDDEDFWLDLFEATKEWGMVLYEQDWLNIQTLYLTDLQEDLTLGERWLTQMGAAAQHFNLTIQYCMSLPRHALQSLTIPVVTQARVSDDYQPGNEQWRIGISSMLAASIGLMPSKDTFWSTRSQPGNPKYLDLDEPNHRLEFIVAALSGGPIGPGDRINHTDVEFIKRCCNIEGKILKPQRPATAIDPQIIKLAMPDTDGPVGEIWTTYSTIVSESTNVNRSFGVIFAADLQDSFTIKWEDLNFPETLRRNSIIYPLDKPEEFSVFNGTFTLHNCSKMEFCFYYLSPLEPGMNGTSMAILGELDKVIPISPSRVTDITHAEIDLNVKVTGLPGEKVTIYFLVGMSSVIRSTCTIGDNGTAQIMSSRCFDSSLHP